MASEEVSKRFDDLAAWIKKSTEVELVRNTVPGYQELASSVREGKSDIAWLGPVIYAWMPEAVTPIGSILRQGKSTYGSALIVREDASPKEVKDLSKTRVGWVDPWSAAGYVIPKIELAKSGINLAAAFRSEAFFGTHRDAVQALLKGECDVVGTYARTADDGTVSGPWNEIEDAKVKVLATFGSIPADVIASRRNLTIKDHEAAVEALKKACTDEEAIPLVKAVFGGSDLQEGTAPGHEELRWAYERALAKGLFD